MWQRFTERARKVVFYAQQEAQRFGEGYVSTEHLLLGIVHEECRATELLEAVGCTREAVREAVEKQLPGSRGPVDTDMTLTPRGKRVIDLAYDEARSHHHNYIGTEHLLAGLLRESAGVAGLVLKSLGVTLEGLWAAAEQTLRESAVQAPPRRINALPGRTGSRAMVPLGGLG